MSGLKQPWAYYLVVLVITSVLFAPSVGYEFIETWDDHGYVTENELVLDPSPENLKRIFVEPVLGNYNPLTILSFAIEYSLVGDNPWLFHLNNLLLHLLCTALVLHLLRRLGLHVWWASFGALLFGIHPMHVESVVWVTERKDVLYACFFLLAILGYLNYKRSPSVLKYLGVLCLFLLSLLSKIQAVSLPLSLIAIDYLLDGKLNWKQQLNKVPMLLMSAVFGLLGIHFLSEIQGLNIQEGIQAWERPFIGSYALLSYFGRFLLPVDLSAFYPYPYQPNDLLPWYFFPCILAFPILFLLYVRFKQHKPLWFGMLFFLVNIVFLLQFLQAGSGYMADRFSYVSYIGLIFGFIYLLKDGKWGSKKWMRPALVVYVAVLFVLAWQHSKTWENSEAVWTNTAEVYENCSLPYELRGVYYSSQDKYAKAERDFLKQVSLEPEDHAANFNLAVAYQRQGKLKQAEASYQRALAAKPDDWQAHLNLGLIYKESGDAELTLKAFRDAHNLAPEELAIHQELAAALVMNGEDALAEAQIKESVKQFPKDARLWNELAGIYFRKGSYEEALAFLRRSIEANPDFAEAYLNEGFIYGSQGMHQDAAAAFARYLKLMPKDAKAHYFRAQSLMTLGQAEQALKSVNKALAILPKDAAFLALKASIEGGQTDN